MQSIPGGVPAGDGGSPSRDTAPLWLLGVVAAAGIGVAASGYKLVSARRV